jgi:hypothetical protein
MNTNRDPDDPHGYRRLNQWLDGLSVRLAGLGLLEEAAAARRASQFFGGSPTEFLGESRIALRAIRAQQLPADLRSEVDQVIDDIDEGFRRVGER